MSFKVLISEQEKENEFEFEVFCPVNETHPVLGPFSMFKNGTFKRNSYNFKDMCPLKQREQSAGIAFDQGRVMGVNNQTNELVETGYWDMSRSLVRSGGYTYIPLDWEIVKLFFTVNNIVPTYLDCWYDAACNNRSWEGPIGKVCLNGFFVLPLESIIYFSLRMVRLT